MSCLFDPIWYVAGINDREVTCQFEQELDRGVEVVCASTTYDSLYPTLSLLLIAKRRDPQVVTILGGPHVDEVIDLPGNRWGTPELVDYAVAGDGELVLLELLRAISQEAELDPSTRDVRGRSTVRTLNGQMRTTGRPLDLDALPFMPIELADVERHSNDFDIFRRDGQISPTVQMIAQRGCSYQCQFCSEQRKLAYPNARSIDSILAEIQFRREQGFRSIFFDDSTFGLYPHLKELLRQLSTTGMSFGCLNRFNHLRSSKLLEQYRDAGFKYFYCSIEQMDDHLLAAMKKGQKAAVIRETMSQLHTLNFRVGVSLLYGFPEETMSSLDATLNFVEEWVTKGTICLVSESALSLHPGTPIGAALAESFNRIPPHTGFPFNRFEEGQWWHPEHVTAKYLERIFRMSEDRFGSTMVRNRHSWYAKQGHIMHHGELANSLGAPGHT